MQISLYIGKRKKKDRIVDRELERYVEGDRSERIKDLILKGLIFEGRKDIDERLLDMRYMYSSNLTAMTIEEEKVENIPKKTPTKEKKPDFSNIKVHRKEIEDDELEDRI
ncbi:hypothetical protein OW763_10700 [Clostridium aestuarii]|uniref:Uncharacterized protein n=1 Tax=Clostridium aestuarii TaxID=338193 RepID=A0ABT4D0Q6_9CLOT|nr:hypothetical protein [Clostridium aestuarii]MCY6484809.1 hypothetical protein [Clostridium aestuarii]